MVASAGASVGAHVGALMKSVGQPCAGKLHARLEEGAPIGPPREDTQAPSTERDGNCYGLAKAQPIGPYSTAPSKRPSSPSGRGTAQEAGPTSGEGPATGRVGSAAALNEYAGDLSKPNGSKRCRQARRQEEPWPGALDRKLRLGQRAERERWGCLGRQCRFFDGDSQVIQVIPFDRDIHARTIGAKHGVLCLLVVTSRGSFEMKPCERERLEVTVIGHHQLELVC
jgi:hypothetical protein